MRPASYKGDVLSMLGEPSAEISANAAGAEDYNFHEFSFEAE